MECDFCGNRCKSLHHVCCPTGDQVCSDCVRRNLINTSTICGLCGVQLGKKIKTLIQESLKAPIADSRNQRQPEMQQNQGQGSFHRTNSQYFGNNNCQRYPPQQQQYHPNFLNQSQRFMHLGQNEWDDCPQMMMNQGRMDRNRYPSNHMRNQMPMNGYSDQGCFNGDMQCWEGESPEQSWNQMSHQFDQFTKNPNLGIPPFQGNFQADPNELFYSNGQMTRQQSRMEHFTTDNLNEGGRSPGRMTRSNSSINIRKNYGNNF